MTNAAILNEYRELNGMSIDEPLYTYNEWKRMGYQVKKGEKSHHKIPIWKYTSKKIKDEDGNPVFDTYTQKEAQEGHMYKKLSAFFTIDQVERVGEAEDE